MGQCQSSSKAVSEMEQNVKMPKVATKKSNVPPPSQRIPIGMMTRSMERRNTAGTEYDDGEDHTDYGHQGAMANMTSWGVMDLPTLQEMIKKENNQVVVGHQ